MGFYSQNGEDTSVKLAGVIECNYEPDITGALGLVCESERNYNKFMKAIGVSELAYFEDNGTEMVYEGAQFSAFLESAKKFFLNMLEKIKGLFKKFFALINSYVVKDKTFVEKYKKHLLSVNISGFKYKGYKFTTEAITVGTAAGKVDGVIKGVSSSLFNINQIPKISDKDELERIVKGGQTEGILNKMMGAAVGGSGEMERGEFVKELFSKFRSGQDSKEEINGVSATEQLAIISNTEANLKDAKKDFTDLEKEINVIIKQLTTAQKESLSNDSIKSNPELSSAKVRALNLGISLLKDKVNVLQTVSGARLTAIKDRNRQAKAICVSLINYKPKSTHEGADFGEDESYSYSEGAFLNVNFK